MKKSESVVSTGAFCEIVAAFRRNRRAKMPSKQYVRFGGYMRYASKRYKAKISELHKKARSNDMSIELWLELKIRCSELKESRRLRDKEGQIIIWEQLSIEDNMVTFPMQTLKGTPLDVISVCFNAESFISLQQSYGDCPEEITVKVTATLEAN